MNHDALLNTGAIVSVTKGQAFLFAARSEPVNERDSGWEFSADAGGAGDPDKAQIWSLKEVLEREPTLQSFMALPSGTLLHRMDADDEWAVTGR